MTGKGDLPELVAPTPALARLAQAHPIIKRTARILAEDSPDRKVLMSAVLAGIKARKGEQLWALELQQILHSPFGNLLNLCFIRLADAFSAKATEEFLARVLAAGVAVGPASGHFEVLSHLDPAEAVPNKPPDPSVNTVKWGAMLDLFTEAKYDVNYRSEGGRLSRVLQLTYDDGTRLDLDIRLISDNIEPAPKQALAHTYVGAAGRLFPLRLSADVTRNLWRAKQDALAKMEESNLEFGNLVAISLAAIEAALPMGTVVGAVPAASGGYRPVRRSPRPVRPPPHRNTAPTSPKARTQSGEIDARGLPAKRPSAGTRTSAQTSPSALTQAGEIDSRGLPTTKSTKRTAPSSTAPRSADQGTAPPRVRGASNAGYRYGDGEVIGQISRSDLPSSSNRTTPYGQAMEVPVAGIIQRRFPDTRFRFRIGRGGTGPDVEWVGGKDPGFDIGDIKPFTDSGFKKFRVQVRRIWRAGPRAANPDSYEAVFFGYEPDGSVTTVGARVGGGRPVP